MIRIARKLGIPEQESTISLPRAKLLQVKKVQELFEQAFEKHPHNITIKLFPAYKAKVLILDPQAKDLKKCQQVFLELFIYENDIGYLSELAAPSFSGKETIGILKKLKKLLLLKSIYFSDGSVILPCNKACTAPLTSLRLFSILSYGQSWYEKQGAKKISEASIQLIDPKNTLVTFRKHFIKNSVYQKAKCFISSLSIDSATRILKASNSSSLALLEKAKALSPSSTTLGSLFLSLKKDHDLTHLLRNVFASFQGSQFLPMAIQAFSSKTSPSKLLQAISLCILIKTPDLKLPENLHNEEEEVPVTVIKTLIFGSSKEIRDLEKTYENYAPKHISYIKTEDLFDEPYPSATKIKEHASNQQIDTWLLHKTERGAKSYIPPLKLSLKYTLNLNLNDFLKLDPDFFATFPFLETAPKNLPFLELLKDFKQSELKPWAEAFFPVLKIGFCNALEALLDQNFRNFSPREQAIIWSLCKTCIEEAEYFEI